MKTITKEELKTMLEDHVAWLNSGSKYLVDFGHIDLSGMDLSCANLTNADLTNANLRYADLHNANLYSADLPGANFNCTDGAYIFGPVGTEKRTGIAVKHDTCVMIQLGCFWGKSEEAIQAVREKYGRKSTYEKQIKLAVEMLEEAEPK